MRWCRMKDENWDGCEGQARVKGTNDVAGKKSENDHPTQLGVVVECTGSEWNQMMGWAGVKASLTEAFLANFARSLVMRKS